MADNDYRNSPSPSIEAAKRSAKLAALHARLSLPSRLPLETLARSLIDPSADPSPLFNNLQLSILGKDLLNYYTSEHLICRYPRLPLVVLYAAIYAYVGPKAMINLTRGWGIEHVAEPGSEVDPGLLQFKQPSRELPSSDNGGKSLDGAEEAPSSFQKEISPQYVRQNEFNDISVEENWEDADETSTKLVRPDKASQNFVRALMGAIYLHGGRSTAKDFFKNHVTSRQLNVSNLFSFRQPTRDLSRLCAREGFQSPVARLIAETGRKSRHPVFLVGIFSGNEKLGEASGSSLDEARTRASVAALKAWYLYSPLTLRVPSETEEVDSEPWKPVMVDPGDIVV